MSEKEPISCPDLLIIPYTSAYSTFHRVLSVRNVSNEPIRILVQIPNDGKKSPFSITYSSRKLFSGEELPVRIDYKSGKDVSSIEEVVLRIICANQVKLVNVKAMPVSNLKAGNPNSKQVPKMWSTLGKRRASQFINQKSIDFPCVEISHSLSKSIDISTLFGDLVPIDVQWEISLMEPIERNVWTISPENSQESKGSFQVVIKFTPSAARTSHQTATIRFQYKGLTGQIENATSKLSLVGTGVDSITKQSTSYTLDMKKAREPKYQDVESVSGFNLSQSEVKQVEAAHKLHNELDKKLLVSKKPLQFIKNQIEIQNRLQAETKKSQNKDAVIYNELAQVETREVNVTSNTPSTLKNKKIREAELMNKAAQFREHEKLKEIKWFKEIGEVPPSQEEKSAIIEQRLRERELASKALRQQKRERKVNDTSVGKPLVQLQSKIELIEASANVNPQSENIQKVLTEPTPEVIQKESSEKSSKNSKDLKPLKGKEKDPPETSELTSIETSQHPFDDILLRKQLVSEFVIFSNQVLLQERVKRRLNFILQRTEDQNINLVLKEAEIPRLNPSLIKIRTFPVPSLENDETTYDPSDDILEMPVFKDFTHLNLKVPLEYKIKGYQLEDPLPLNIYMQNQELFDYQSLATVPFPVKKDITHSSTEESHQTIVQLMKKCNEIILNNLYNPPITDTPEVAIFGFEETIRTELDPSYEILSMNKKVLADAYQRLSSNSNSDHDTQIAVFRTYSEQFEEPIPFSNNFKIQLDPMHPAVKRRNVPLESYLTNDDIPLRPFTVCVDNIESLLDEKLENENTSDSTSSSSQTNSVSTNYASVIANLSLTSLYPELTAYIKADVINEIDKNDKGKKKAPPKKGEVVEDSPPKNIEINLSNDEFQSIVLSQTSEGIQKMLID